MKERIPTRRPAVIAITLICLLGLQPARGAELKVPAQYATIQAAVNAAASGDTIHIAAGVYAEQITIIGKRLTLVGESGSSIIRAKPDMAPTLAAHGFRTVPLFGVATADVSVKWITFDGNHVADAYPDFGFAGIMFSGANGVVEHCVVKGFRNTDTLSPFDAFGFVAANSLVPESVNVQILRTTFQDNASSIHVRGAREAPESQRLTFTIAENGVIGVGPTASGPQIGILIGTGASGEVKRNIISDHFSTRGDTDYPSVGLLAMDEGLLFGWRQNPAPLLSVSCESNTFRLNQHHLNCFKGNGARISNNTFEGAGAGFRPTGLMLSGESTLVKGNWFSEIPTGITLLGEDPDYGTTLGIARDATLLDNRFCHVTMPVNVQSLAVGITNQGTVLCPLPAPTLTIERRLIVPGTVFLSWPKYPDAWLYELEIAPTPQGTWVPVGKSSLEIHDTKSIALETDNSPRFFRLRSRSQP